MISLRLENLRCLEDTGFIDIKPLTLLLGGNSTGKSTLLRFFPLIKQSFSRKITGPILWAGDEDYVDFGSFEESIYRGAKETSIDITFKTKIDRDDAIYYRRNYLFYSSNRNRRKNKENIEVILKVSIISEEVDYVKRMCVEAFNSIIEMSLNKNGLVTEIKIDDLSITKKVYDIGVIKSEQNSLIPIIHILPEKVEDENETFYYVSNRFSPIIKWFKKRSKDSRLKEDNYANLAFKAITLLQSGELDIIEALKRTISKKSLLKILNGISEKERKEIRALILLTMLTEITETTNIKIRKDFENSYYIAPLRAEANRYYRIRNISAQEIDYQGKNIALLLNSLSYDENEDLKKWMEKNFDFFPIIEGSGKGHLTIKIQDRNSGDYNLTDTGFGYSQILPIAVQLWLILNKKNYISTYEDNKDKESVYLLIEQPELHLHPALQAKFLDVIVSSLDEIRKKLNLFIVLETHSESIVNRVGKHVARNSLNKNDVNVLLFSKGYDKNSSQIEYAEYDEKGYLRNWPMGFLLPEELE